MSENSMQDTNRGSWEYSYLNLMADVLLNGEERGDRTGTGTTSVFGRSLDIDLSAGFPAVTTKKLMMKGVTSENLWFIEGSGDERRLAEILHGTRERSIEKEELIQGELVKTQKDLNTIWTANAEAPYWKPRAKFEGDLGQVYGVQWRSWPSIDVIAYGNESIEHQGGVTTHLDAKIQVSTIDQLARVIDAIKNNPNDRRMIVSAWNVGELHNMALPPCHMMMQFYVSKDRKLSCQMYQRSVDVFLGLPFNIASYALLTSMIAHVTGCTPGRLIMSLGDVHVYQNHIDQALLQLSRAPMAVPKLWLNPEVKNIDGFTMQDIRLDGYASHAAIAAPMAV